jgi:hypothetical protein
MIKGLRQICAASFLTLALSTIALAGQIDTGIAPTSAPATGQIETPVNGDIETGVADQTSTTAPATDSTVEAALNLLQGVLALF